jgi:D-alanyl-D-alanine carboxypeptidase (penicillin-binding protein 5/6)
VTDLKTGEYLAGSEASEPLPMASTTKVMGALVALETDLDEEVTVSEEAAAFAVPAYSNVGLLPGDVLSARELSTEYATIATPYREIPLTNTNELLFAYPPATGVKTGTTPAAGESLVSSATRGDEAYAFVILDAGEDRFGASIRALEHAFAAYDRADLVVRGEKYAGADVPYRRERSIDLMAARDVEGLVDASPEVEREITVMKNPPDSARAGTRFGEVVVKVDGRVVGESPLVARRGYEEASLWERVWYTVGGVFA